MIQVYYTKVSPFLEEDAFWRRFQQIEEARRARILKMKNQKAKMQSLFAGSLLHYALCRELGLDEDRTGPFAIGIQEGGKPFFRDKPEICFNLSHSGEYVCCALGREPVGADIQEHTGIREGLAERFFTAEDKRRLSQCRGKEREKLFFQMWSIKESYIKLTGRGLGQGLSSFEIQWQEKRIWENGQNRAAAFFEQKDPLPGYSACLCFGSPGQQVVWQEVSQNRCRSR